MTAGTSRKCHVLQDDSTHNPATHNLMFQSRASKESEVTWGCNTAHMWWQWSIVGTVIGKGRHEYIHQCCDFDHKHHTHTHTHTHTHFEGENNSNKPSYGVQWRYTKCIKIKRYRKPNLYILVHSLHFTNSLNFWVLFSQFLELKAVQKIFPEDSKYDTRFPVNI